MLRKLTLVHNIFKLWQADTFDDCLKKAISTFLSNKLKQFKHYILPLIMRFSSFLDWLAPLLVLIVYLW